ncbi:MAG: NACHT domain-containing protein [Opitutales bacterium]
MLTPITGIVGKKVFEKVALDVYKFLGEKAKGSIQKWRADKGISELYSQISSIRLVKTLWQVDKPVDLAEFYCYPRVRFSVKRRKEIRDLNDLNRSKGGVLIQGIAGQGKSTFLRYLCAREMQKGEKLPVFLELRKINEDQTLFDHIKVWLEVLGIELDESSMKEIGRSGKLIFFLDGFDEVREDLRLKLITEIEYLISLCKKSVVIVSSRPDNGIDVSPSLDVVQLENLHGDEYEDVVRRLAVKSRDAEHLISQVNSHGSNIKDLLITPLFVTLLLITYKSFQELPDELADFYDALFQVLLKRHDGTKPGFKRERHCSINDKQYRFAFDSFCYESKRSRIQSFSDTEVYNFAKVALNKRKFDADPEGFLNDIIKVTCLLVRDGGEYRFIHKSVQEYFAASFLSSRPENVIRKFYESLIENSRFKYWEQEFKFLEEIDRFRYIKFFRLPMLRRNLGLSEGDTLKIPRITLKRTVEILGGVNIVVFQGSRNNRVSLIDSGALPFDLFPFRELLDLDYSTVSYVKSGVKVAAKNGSRMKDARIMTLGTVIRRGELREETKAIVAKVLQKIFDEALGHEKWLEEAQEEDLTLDFPELSHED